MVGEFRFVPSKGREVPSDWNIAFPPFWNSNYDRVSNSKKRRHNRNYNRKICKAFPRIIQRRSIMSLALFKSSDLIIFYISSKLKSIECSLNCVRTCWIVGTFFQRSTLFGKECFKCICFCFYICYKFII